MANEVKGFTISKWKDLQDREFDNYDCNECEYSTLDVEKAKKHLATATGSKGHGHAWKKAPVEEGEK